MKKFLFLSLCLIGYASVAAPAKKTATPPKPATATVSAVKKSNQDLFPEKEVDVLHFLPGFPKLNSAASKEDFAELERLEKTRSPLECERAKREATGDLVDFFAKPKGPLTTAEVNQWKPFLEKVLKEGKEYLDEAKTHWARPRPYVSDQKLHPCVPKENTFAYPSGHAAAAELISKVLAKKFPAHEKEILVRGYLIGQDRLIGGVHHPSDVRDGRMLGFRFYQILLDHGKI